MSETEERLQRQVRAMGAVNRQLQAQLEGGRTWTPSLGRGEADLLTSPGRGPAEAEALMSWMERNQDAWRT